MIEGRLPMRNHVDSFPDMALRRELSNFADQPMDFYFESLQFAQECLGLGSGDSILDVGCSSGQFLMDAAQAMGVPSWLIGVDPDPTAYRLFLPPRYKANPRFTFYRGKGEDMSFLPDNSVRMAMAHNALFRAEDHYQMLAEMKRVTEPGGLILISTNEQDHARWRHWFENLAAVAVSQELGLFLDPLHPPAHGCYLSQIPDIASQSGGLEMIRGPLVQRSQTRITRERLPLYVYSLKLSANRIQVGDPTSVRQAWYATVDSLAERIIERHLRRHETAIRKEGGSIQPYFPDPVHRGICFFRNCKSSQQKGPAPRGG